MRNVKKIQGCVGNLGLDTLEFLNYDRITKMLDGQPATPSQLAALRECPFPARILGTHIVFVDSSAMLQILALLKMDDGVPFTPGMVWELNKRLAEYPRPKCICMAYAEAENAFGQKFAEFLLKEVRPAYKLAEAQYDYESIPAPSYRPLKTR